MPDQLLLIVTGMLEQLPSIAVLAGAWLWAFKPMLDAQGARLERLADAVANLSETLTLLLLATTTKEKN